MLDFITQKLSKTFIIAETLGIAFLLDETNTAVHVSRYKR
jgi:hypothetical protein